MELQVFIGLSVDKKLFGGRDPASQELEALLEQASEQFAAHLAATVAAQGSPLRQIHATCGLFEATDTSASRARFRRQGEQLEVECAIDWRPWLERPALAQAGCVVEHAGEAMATALENKQQRTLADACRAFRPAFDLDAALAKQRAWLEGGDSSPGGG
jgi:hypothetical protein